MQLRIKERREQRGLSVAELAELIGRRRNTVFYYESGHINISLGMLESIAKVLECTVQDLLPEEKTEEAALASN